MSSNLKAAELFDVSGRCVAITGAASGIGLMLARGFAANGSNTILIDRNEGGLADAKQQVLAAAEDFESGQQKPSVTTILGDLSSEEGVASIVTRVKSLCKSLDVLIHCAGLRFMNKTTYLPGESLARLEAATLSAPYKDWELAFRVNVMASYYLTAGLVSLLGDAAAKGDGRGCVILFSSPASVHNHQFVPCYQTTKASVDHLVRIMAAEFASFYIRVNAMSPGMVMSGMTPNDGTSNLRLVKDSPARRAGIDEDMVGCALWLASKAGSFMDGKIVRNEGGRLLVLKGVLSNSD